MVRRTDGAALTRRFLGGVTDAGGGRGTLTFLFAPQGLQEGWPGGPCGAGAVFCASALAEHNSMAIAETINVFLIISSPHHRHPQVHLAPLPGSAAWRAAHFLTASMTVSLRSSPQSLRARPAPLLLLPLSHLLLLLQLILLRTLRTGLRTRRTRLTRRSLRRRWPWRGRLKRRVAIPYDRAYNLAGRTGRGAARGLGLGADACESQQCGDDRQQ